MATPVWIAPYASLPVNSSTGASVVSISTNSPAFAGVGALELRDPHRAERAGGDAVAEHVHVGGDVVAHDVVRAAEPEAGAFAAGIVGGAAVAAARRELARALGAQREVVLEHVEALGAVLGHDARAARVVDDVVLNEPVVAVVNGDAPLRRVVDRVADQRELVAVGRRRLRSEGVVEVQRVAADLVRADAPQRAVRWRTRCCRARPSCVRPRSLNSA